MTDGAREAGRRSQSVNPNDGQSGPEVASLPGAGASSTAPRARRGRLFRKYLLLILTLVTGALLASGAISIYFT